MRDRIRRDWNNKEAPRATVLPFVDYYIAFRVRSSSSSASTSFWHLTVHSSLARGSLAYKSVWSSTVIARSKRDKTFSSVSTSAIQKISVLWVKTHFRTQRGRRHRSLKQKSVDWGFLAKELRCKMSSTLERFKRLTETAKTFVLDLTSQL